MTTWDPANKSASATLSNGNLTVATTTLRGICRSTATVVGKKYWEITADCGTVAAQFNDIGMVKVISLGASATIYDTNNKGIAIALSRDHWFLFDNTTTLFSNIAYTLNQFPVCMCAYDQGANLYYFGIDGNWLGSTDPNAGTGGITPNQGSGAWFPAWSDEQTLGGATANFVGPFLYGPPTGFSALDAPATGPHRLVGLATSEY